MSIYLILVPSPLLTKPANKKTRRKKRAKALKKEDKEGGIDINFLCHL